MKKLIALFGILAFITLSTFSCKKEPPQPASAPRSTTTLNDSATINFTCAWGYYWQYEIYHTIGIGYNAIDINSNVFFVSHDWISKANTGIEDTIHYSFRILPGTYYYKDRAYCNGGACKTDTIMNTDKVKQAAFTVAAGQTMNISTYLYAN